MTLQRLKSRSGSPASKLIVFEGADGVGKTTVLREVFDELRQNRVNVERSAFPGSEAGTVGRLVYDIHHQPQRLGIDAISPTSLQTLHVAAHVDAIETRIVPALRSGAWVLLDRFWWSTWVYGIVAQMPIDVLRSLIHFERSVWGAVEPGMIFHLVRPGVEDPRVRAEYDKLVSREASSVPVVQIATNKGVDATRFEVIDALQARAAIPRRHRE